MIRTLEPEFYISTGCHVYSPFIEKTTESKNLKSC